MQTTWKVLVLAVVMITLWTTLAFQTDDGRWLFEASSYKRQVLAQPSSVLGHLKHIEWDSWGIAGQDNSVFLVYDPGDKLAEGPHDKAGRYAGIACEVPYIRALEPKWYLVRFYTNTDWDNCDY